MWFVFKMYFPYKAIIMFMRITDNTGFRFVMDIDRFVTEMYSRFCLCDINVY